MKHYSIILYIQKQIAAGKLKDFKNGLDYVYDILWRTKDIDWTSLSHATDPCDFLIKLEENVCSGVNHVVRDSNWCLQVLLVHISVLELYAVMLGV